MRLACIVLLVVAATCAPGCSDSGEVPAGPPQPAAEVDAAATSFSVVIETVPTRKIDAIKAVRQVTRLGLKDSKDLVESPPAVVAAGLPRAAADEMAAVLSSAGIDVAVRPD